MSKSLKKLIDINRLREFKNKLVGMDSPCVQTGAVDQTVAGTKTFSKPIVGSVTGSSGSCTGNAATATTAGAVSTSVAADNTKDLVYATMADNDRCWIRCGGASDAGYLEIATGDNGNDPIYVRQNDNMHGSVRTLTLLDRNGNTQLPGTVTAPTFSGNLTGNAATATQFSANATVALTGDATGTSAGSKKGWSVPVTLANSGVTAGTYGPSADVTGNNNATISVPEITVDAKGRVTSVVNRSLTCKNNTYTVNNATLTIQKNGSNVATFTSNASANATANITVPTKTSELTNDSGFLTSHQSLSNYVTLNGDQTISGAKTLSADTLTGLAGNGYRIINGSSKVSTGYGVFQRTDSGNWYLLVTAKDDALGSWTTARPAQMTLSTGILSINGNAATATKLAAKRTIALSGAATGTATGFDGSGNITIPVTALASSAIRAQWYAAYPDGAEAHNAMWGGRDITAAFNAGTVSEHIADGTFKDIFPGDYITKQVTIPQVLADDGTTVLFAGGTYTVNWVVADCDYWWHKGDNTVMETHHVVIVPQAPIFNANMNATNTTEGGYAGSRMYTETIPACATGIVSAFGSDHILTFRDSITRAVNTSSISSGAPFWTGASSDWGWYDAQCNLMCERMVYGMPAFSSSAWDAGVATRQFSAFRLSERLINYNRGWWWLRDVVSSAYFAFVAGYGYADASAASYSNGVRPFALLV